MQDVRKALTLGEVTLPPCSPGPGLIQLSGTPADGIARLGTSRDLVPDHARKTVRRQLDQPS